MSVRWARNWTLPATALPPGAGTTLVMMRSPVWRDRPVTHGLTVNVVHVAHGRGGRHTGSAPAPNASRREIESITNVLAESTALKIANSTLSSTVAPLW